MFHCMFDLVFDLNQLSSETSKNQSRDIALPFKLAIEHHCHLSISKSQTHLHYDKRQESLSKFIFNLSW